MQKGESIYLTVNFGAVLVDTMTFVAWKLSGFPPYRVIGSGTILESARFRYLISQRLGVAPEIIQAFIIGEQGNNSSKFFFEKHRRFLIDFITLKIVMGSITVLFRQRFQFKVLKKSL